jgi:hypothetical protein
VLIKKTTVNILVLSPTENQFKKPADKTLVKPKAGFKK